MIPSSIHGLIETRKQLPAMLRAFRDRGPRGLFAFGRHSRAEAVILPWMLFEQLAGAAGQLEDATRVAELERRRRHPTGPTRVTGEELARFLTLPPGPAPVLARPLLVWPTALDDLLRMAEDHPLVTRQIIAGVLGAIVAGQQNGTPLTTLPGQPKLPDHYRLYARGCDPSTGELTGDVITVTFAKVSIATAERSACTPEADTIEDADGGEGVELLAVAPAGPLISALHDLLLKPVTTDDTDPLEDTDSLDQVDDDTAASQSTSPLGAGR